MHYSQLTDTTSVVIVFDTEVNHSRQTNTTSKSRRFCLGLMSIFGFYGCSANSVHSESIRQLKHVRDVRVQVCLPSKKVYFADVSLDRLENHPNFTKYSPQQLDIAPKIVRRVIQNLDSTTANDQRLIKNLGIKFGEVLVRNGQFSDGTGFMNLADSTVSNQPIYENKFGYPEQYYLALHVELYPEEQGPEGGVTYWFKLPKVVTEDFTSWFDPVALETRRTREYGSVWSKLTRGKELTASQIPPHAPKMRAALIRKYDQHNDPISDTLPALTTARAKYRTAESDEQYVYQFVEKSLATVPSCD